VFRPQVPVNVADGERVSLIIASTSNIADLADVADLLDAEFMEACCRRSTDAAPLDEIRKKLNAFGGSLSDLISKERDER
jgi:hypothetical protein